MPLHSAYRNSERAKRCFKLPGEWDYLLRIVVKDIAAFDAFYKRLISGIGGLSNVTSSFSMEEVKYTTKLPIA